MKFFQGFVLVVAVLSALFAIDDKPDNRKGFVALFGTAGVLFLMSWAMTSII